MRRLCCDYSLYSQCMDMYQRQKETFQEYTDIFHGILCCKMRYAFFYYGHHIAIFTSDIAKKQNNKTASRILVTNITFLCKEGFLLFSLEKREKHCYRGKLVYTRLPSQIVSLQTKKLKARCERFPRKNCFTQLTSSLVVT